MEFEEASPQLNDQNIKITAAASHSNVKKVKSSKYIGFDSLPYQLVDENAENKFSFNIMCVGETGLGKSTLMDTLFNCKFESTPNSYESQNVYITSDTYELHENGVHLELNICETVGYGDQVNEDDSSQAIVDYIDSQFESYLREELKIERSLSTFYDGRIHVCLYFIRPNDHGLMPLDLTCLKKLHNKVNIIPIIAKADTISMIKLQHLKEKIIQKLTSDGIRIYRLPVDNNGWTESGMPFAVIGSNEFVRIGDKMVRGRQYSWGTCAVENESHCDIVKLREMLIGTNTRNMCHKTNSIYYELYRQKRLIQMGFGDEEGKLDEAHTKSITNLIAAMQYSMEINADATTSMNESECATANGKCAIEEHTGPADKPAGIANVPAAAYVTVHAEVEDTTIPMLHDSSIFSASDSVAECKLGNGSSDLSKNNDDFICVSKKDPSSSSSNTTYYELYRQKGKLEEAYNKSQTNPIAATQDSTSSSASDSLIEFDVDSGSSGSSDNEDDDFILLSKNYSSSFSSSNSLIEFDVDNDSSDLIDNEDDDFIHLSKNYSSTSSSSDSSIEFDLNV